MTKKIGFMLALSIVITTGVFAQKFVLGSFNYLLNASDDLLKSPNWAEMRVQAIRQGLERSKNFLENEGGQINLSAKPETFLHLFENKLVIMSTATHYAP